MTTPLTPENQASYTAGTATGALVRGFTDGGLGRMPPEDVYNLASNAVSDPGALGLLMGVDPEDTSVVDPIAVRDAVMAVYDGQRAADALVAAQEAAARMREATISRRYDSMFRHAKVTPEQLERLEIDTAAGDDTPLNRIREKYFFE